MKNGIQVQPGFVTPGDDVMALVRDVSATINDIIKNEQEGEKPLSKSEKVATSDPQSVSTSGDKGAPNVKTGDPQIGLGKGEGSTSSSGGGMLPVKKGEGSESSSSTSEGTMAKASPSAGDEGSASSPSAGGPPSPGGEGSASAGAPPSGDAGAPPPAGDPGMQAPGGEQGAAPGPSYPELVQMYMEVGQSSPEDLQAHAAAIQEAMQSLQGGAPGAAGPGAPPSPGMGAPPSAPPSAGPGPGMGAPPSPGMPPMGKSESTVMAELKKTQDDLSAMAEALRVVVTRPQRKAVTGQTGGIEFIPFRKSEDPIAGAKPTFAELKKNATALHTELKRLTMPDSPLGKKERELVNDFYCRRISVDDLAPVFAEPKK